ncbi:MAG: DUF1080 domain-containing protein [Planctomycetaceae bacterium]|jgi:hypothetical protein|nr:DUF1080 domain-containing protein [Planctomycetaceae bacterium]
MKQIIVQKFGGFFVIISVAFILVSATLIFAQTHNPSGTSPSNKPSTQSKASTPPRAVNPTPSASNPFSILMPSYSKPNSPDTSAAPPKSTAPNPTTPPQISSISPSSGENDILLLPGNSTARPGRKTREDIIREKAQQAAEARKNNAQYGIRNPNEYDFERLRYESDIAKLIAIDNATSPYVRLTAQNKTAENLTTTKSDSDPNNTENKLSTITTNNNITTSTTPISPTKDRDIAIMELQLAKLMASSNAQDKIDEIEAITRRIERRKVFLEKQEEALHGADIFVVDKLVQLTTQSLEDGWCNLFDGKTLFGWRTQTQGHYGGGRFHVYNGEIQSDPYHPGLLYTTNQFGDSTISLDYCADADSEVFLLYRTSPDPNDLKSSCYTIVLNSSDSNRPRGTIFGRAQLDIEQVRAVETESLNNKKNKTKKIWRTARIQGDGNTFTCTIDQHLPVVFTDPMPIGRGYVGLLVTKGKVSFRNIIWQPNSMNSLFDGIELDSTWRCNQSNLTMSVGNDYAIQLRGGTGVAESVIEHDDFVLQCEYRINTTSGKLGLFFRSNLKKDKSGYEISLQNFPTRVDRDEIFGVDAGSFANRKSARYVGASDLKWNFLTLVAVDRHFQTWINGIPVCELTDKSPLPKKIQTTNNQNVNENDKNKDNPDEYMIPTNSEYHRKGTLQFHIPISNSSIDIRQIRISKIQKRHKK